MWKIALTVLMLLCLAVRLKLLLSSKESTGALYATHRVMPVLWSLTFCAVHTHTKTTHYKHSQRTVNIYTTCFSCTNYFLLFLLTHLLPKQTANKISLNWKQIIIGSRFISPVFATRSIMSI